MYQYKDSKNTLKRKSKKDIITAINSIKHNDQQNNKKTEMGRKNNSMDISSDKMAKFHTRTWLWKGNFKKEIESISIADQNNVIRTNYIKAKID